MTNFLAMANATYQGIEKALSDAHTQLESGDYLSCEGSLSLSSVLIQSLERTLSKIPTDHTTDSTDSTDSTEVTQDV